MLRKKKKISLSTPNSPQHNTHVSQSQLRRHISSSLHTTSNMIHLVLAEENVKKNCYFFSKRHFMTHKSMIGILLSSIEANLSYCWKKNEEQHVVYFLRVAARLREAWTTFLFCQASYLKSIPAKPVSTNGRHWQFYAEVSHVYGCSRGVKWPFVAQLYWSTPH